MSGTESLWQEISVAALLGTQRRPFQPPDLGGELGSLLEAIQSAELPAVPASSSDESASGNASGSAAGAAAGASERSLLRSAALAGLHRRAGRLPALKSPVFPAPAAPDTRPRCSVQAGRCLDQILTGGPADLLPEWIEIANQRRVRVREESLPDLLNKQKALLPLRRDVLPVLGERGRWLAAQHPDWNVFIQHGDRSGRWGEHVWTDGQKWERLACLEDLREQDPNRARELLAATWEQESPSDRVAFLQTFSNGLSMADEPFLESLLDERRKDVRLAAAGLLARLPGSRLVQRMSERGRILLTWKNGLLRSSLEVTLPDACDAGMQRDGVDPRVPAGARLGEKAWWLAQVLSFVPPRTWSGAWNRRPQQILETIRKNEWEAALVEGWSEAALCAQDEEWLEALINYHYKSSEQKRMLDLYPRLPAEVKERLVLSLLREYPSLSYDQTASIFLAACRHPWSPDLTQAVTTCICYTLQKGDLQPWRWEKLLRDIPPFFHPDLLESCIERIHTAHQKRADPFVANLLTALEFRQELRSAFE